MNLRTLKTTTLWLLTTITTLLFTCAGLLLTSTPPWKSSMSTPETQIMKSMPPQKLTSLPKSKLLLHHMIQKRATIQKPEATATMKTLRPKLMPTMKTGNTEKLCFEHIRYIEIYRTNYVLSP